MEQQDEQVRLAAKFKEVLPFENCITPDVIEYIKKGDFIIELSADRGGFGLRVAGVTTINYSTREMVQEYCNSFCKHNYQAAVDAARKYIKEIEI